MIQDEIIEECKSPWCRPIVLVPKKAAEPYCLCVDYRKLNSITVSDYYPMPEHEELLHIAKRTPYMSTTDLNSGFWQVPVAEEDRHNTCFTSPFGIYRFLGMPFGLRNSPATFVRLIDHFRAGLKEWKVFTYMGDILLLLEQHLSDFMKIFD